jgi:hypothetical protein
VPREALNSDMRLTERIVGFNKLIPGQINTSKKQDEQLKALQLREDQLYKIRLVVSDSKN